MTGMGCAHPGCPRLARWRVGFRAWAKGYAKGSHPPLGGFFEQYVVCEDHKAGIKVEDLLLPEGRAMIERANRAIGKAPPDFDTAELAFRDLLYEGLPVGPLPRERMH